jgi:phosphoglycolate phosphatase-like HAD superfamily hydrolase
VNVVFDLDGTLCDTSKRELLAANAAREASPEVAQRVWDEFHAGIPNDSPVHPIKKTLLALASAGHTIEIWTARPEKYQDVTIAWLRKHGVPFNHLLMRDDPDRRPSPIVKLEWFFLSYREAAAAGRVLCRVHGRREGAHMNWMLISNFAFMVGAITLFIGTFVSTLHMLGVLK